MLKSDIIEVIGATIERKIGGEWKHEVGILGCSSVHVNFVVDEKEYVIVLHEITEGHDFSEYVSFHLPPIGKSPVEGEE